MDLELKARQRARWILPKPEIEPTLSALREKLITVYPDDMDMEAVEEASRFSCQLIDGCKAFSFEGPLIKEELDRISGECLKVF
ncbi:MAG: hypothetical protein FJ115_02885 [Deltaproteobacteria bacterium]|nr:hypothetical protein [Deltaproteobacteria bacterium]